jgi:hypothetical protein
MRGTRFYLNVRRSSLARMLGDRGYSAARILRAGSARPLKSGFRYWPV